MSARDTRRAARIVKRTLVSFYDDQMTHHAAALTYYSLMSLFPAVLLALSLLGLVGQYPATYDAIMGYLREVAPQSVLLPLDSSLRAALQAKGTAATALIVSVVVALYGTTGVLEAARRALNVVFEVPRGRSFLRRKVIDVASSLLLMTLILTSLVMAFVGGRFAEDLLGFIGLGPTAARIWNIARWPGALLVAMLVFAFVYYVTPDVRQRSFRWITPGAIVGVLLWLAASYGLGTYLSIAPNVTALYGAFTGAIVLVGWLWLTNVSLLLGAELNAEIDRQRELAADPVQAAVDRDGGRRDSRPMDKRIDRHGVLGPRGIQYSWVYCGAIVAMFALLIVDIFDDGAIWNYGVIVFIIIAIAERPGGLRGPRAAAAPEEPAAHGT